MKQLFQFMNVSFYKIALEKAHSADLLERTGKKQATEDQIRSNPVNFAAVFSGCSAAR
jgi:hypothetical protein